jgi:hypothetical protein
LEFHAPLALSQGDASQRQMGRKGALLARDAHRRRGEIDVRGEFGEAGRLDAAPEIARGVRIREEAHAPDAHGNDGARRQACQGRLQFTEALLGPFADELGGDMQVGRRAPLNARGRLQTA